MVIFHIFEISSQPILVIKPKQKKTAGNTTTRVLLSFHAVLIISQSLTCLKTRGKGITWLKTLNNDHFHNFEHSSLSQPCSKNKIKTTGLETASNNLFFLSSSNIIHSSTCNKTWGIVLHAVSCLMDFNMLCHRVELGGVLKLMKNDHLLVFFIVWVLFPKCLGRLRNGLY